MTHHLKNFETLGQYHDFWSVVLMDAPNEFRDIDGNTVDQSKALEEAYESLKLGFVLVERKIKSPRQLRIIREMIDMSYEAYLAGEQKIGAHTLQECEGLIWPSRKTRLKYVVEAERRAFGAVESYAEVKVSSYPYEGTESDVTPQELMLYKEATARCLEFFVKKVDFKPFVLTLDPEGVVRQTRQLSWSKMKVELACLAVKGESQGFVRSEVVVSGMSGVLIHDIETKGRPRVSIRALVKDYVCGAAHFHFDEPTVLDTDARY